MGPMTQSETVLHGAIIEMLDLEVTLDRALRDQIEEFDSAHPDVVHHLKYVATFTAAHITQLRELGTRNATLAGRLGNAVRRAGSVLSGFSTSAADFLRNASVPEYLRRDYTAACLAYAGYRMLFTTASALRDVEIRRMAAELLSDYARITLILQDLLPDAVVTKLEADGLRLEEPAIRSRNSNRIGHLAAHAG